MIWGLPGWYQFSSRRNHIPTRVCLSNHKVSNWHKDRLGWDLEDPQDDTIRLVVDWRSLGFGSWMDICCNHGNKMVGWMGWYQCNCIQLDQHGFLRHRASPTLKRRWENVALIIWSLFFWYPNSPFVAFLNQSFEIIGSSKVWVYLIEIGHPISMITSFIVQWNWRNPNCIKTHICDIVKMVDNSLPSSTTIFTQITVISIIITSGKTISKQQTR